MHPFVKILTFIFILLLMNFLSKSLLLVFCLIVCIVAANINLKNFFIVIKRMRIFFVSIFIIYVFGTPGEYMWQYPMSIAPTYEGVDLGVIQIEKLVISLAALSMLFSTNSKENLMVGLYVLLSPLKYLGLSVERFTARLLLTFDYVEMIAMSDKRKLVFQQLDDIHADSTMPFDKVVELQDLPYNMLDKLFLVGFIALVLFLIALKVWA